MILKNELNNSIDKLKSIETEKMIIEIKMREEKRQKDEIKEKV